MIRRRSSISKILMLVLAVPVGLWLLVSSASAADIEIFKPRNEETVHNNDGNVTVEVMARGLTFRLRNIERGEHTLQALIVDERGYVVTRSQPVIFFMWQASRRFPSRVKPTPQGR
jgi:hypothetical protein